MKCKYNICNGSGFILKKDENNEIRAEPCKCRAELDEAHKLSVQFETANIPKVYWKYTFEDYCAIPFSADIKKRNSEGITVFKQLLENPKQFTDTYTTLWIHGPDANSGHTTLAVLFCKELIKLGNKVHYTTMQSLLDSFTEFENKSEYFSDLDSCDVVLLDDAFDVTRSVAKGEYTRIQLFNWVQKWCSNNKKLVCTSNISPRQVSMPYLQSALILQRSICNVILYGDISLYQNM
jgi:chromosomal replication initiation ATPase DnaA